MKYGYIRPIDLYDVIPEQEKKIKIYTHNIIRENHTDTKNRYQLDRLLNDILKPNDQLYVTDLCIFADSTKQLVDIVNSLDRDFISIRIINPSMFISPTPRYTFNQILSEISNFQSDVVRFRTKEGVNSATKKGKQMGRPKRNDENIRKAIEMYTLNKFTLDEIKSATNISRATLYRHLDK